MDMRGNRKEGVLEMSVMGVWLVCSRRIGMQCDGDDYHRQAKFSAREPTSQPASQPATATGISDTRISAGKGISRREGPV